jgi:hypothetical protein
MTDSIAGLPFWEIRFDADGDPDTGRRDTLLAEVPAHGITDLVVFAHGWNNDPAAARRLYDGFFGLLAGQLGNVPADRPVTVGLAGVVWPSQQWSDEPIPDFSPSPGAAAGGGAASVTPTPAAGPGAAVATIDADTLAGLRETFPAAAPALDRMAALLEGPPTAEAQAAFHASLKDFAALAGTADDDGEGDPAGPPDEPRMLLDDPTVLFERYRDALRASGVDLDAGAGGEAGIGDFARGIWNGAKEALRGATYWQMKNRAGTIGRAGLGPLIGQLHTAAPQLRVHLVGHSFGARLVSYALAGLPDGLSPSPVRAVTLLEGAFSHFAFARPLPFDASRSGALAGMQARIAGPLTVCFSVHDGAVGTFYPLASLASGDDSAAAQNPLFRWGGMGADGAQGVDAALDAIQPAGPGATYRFSPDRVLNVDASEIVRNGPPPSGAHSDIVHPELSWVVLAAGGIT